MLYNNECFAKALTRVRAFFCLGMAHLNINGGSENLASYCQGLLKAIKSRRENIFRACKKNKKIVSF